MTEEQWLACGDPEAMLEFLRGKAGDRKLRLFACNCWRLFVARARPEDNSDPGDPEQQHNRRALLTACALAETHADGSAWPPDMDNGPEWYVWMRDAVDAARGTAGDERLTPVFPLDAQAALLRCVFANPFRPLRIEPAWRTPTALGLAEAAYEERLMPAGELDPVRLAVLADALEEAGADAGLVAHLRSAGPHVRGCFAVDAVLGKE